MKYVRRYLKSAQQCAPTELYLIKARSCFPLSILKNVKPRRQDIHFGRKFFQEIKCVIVHGMTLVRWQKFNFKTKKKTFVMENYDVLQNVGEIVHL